MKRWVELVLAVKKKDYENLVEPGKWMGNKNGSIHIIIRTEKYMGFDVKLFGYLVERVGSKLKKSKVRLVCRK